MSNDLKNQVTHHETILLPNGTKAVIWGNSRVCQAVITYPKKRKDDIKQPSEYRDNEVKK